MSGLITCENNTRFGGEEVYCREQVSFWKGRNVQVALKIGGCILVTAIVAGLLFTPASPLAFLGAALLLTTAGKICTFTVIVVTPTLISAKTYHAFLQSFAIRPVRILGPNSLSRIESHEEISVGKSAQKILELQKKLSSESSPKARKKICQHILNEFQKFEGNYKEMLALRKEIDEAELIGKSKLFKLIYEDCDVETGYAIISLIHRCYEQEKLKGSAIPRIVRLYTDVDDTMKPTLNDKQVNIKEVFYPGAILFYTLLSQSISSNFEICMTILSARPAFAEALLKRGIKHDFPEYSRIACLFGSSEGAGKAVNHYAIGPLKKAIDSEAFDASQKDTYQAFARDKRQNIERDLLLWPEAEGMMIGDTGEGDVLFMEEMQKAQSVLNDGRIPQGLAPPKLKLGFAHAISSRSDGEYGPGFKHRADREALKENSIFIMDNFVDAALECGSQNLLSHHQVDLVAREVQNWIVQENEGILAALKNKSDNHGIHHRINDFSIDAMNDAQFNKESEVLSPYLQYRLRAIRSLERAFKLGCLGSKVTLRDHS